MIEPLWNELDTEKAKQLAKYAFLWGYQEACEMFAFNGYDTSCQEEMDLALKDFIEEHYEPGFLYVTDRANTPTSADYAKQTHPQSHRHL